MVSKQQTISDDAVKEKTGKNWAEWFKILDKAGASKMNHTQIAAYLYDELGVPGWWNQMVANQYEQARGLRERHEMPDGYQISASKTFIVPLSNIYIFWENKNKRKLWLKGDLLEITTATKDKSIRGRWGKSRIDVGFYPKGEDKCQVALGHNKIPDSKEAAKMKTYWATSLVKLQKLLEK